MKKLLKIVLPLMLLLTGCGTSSLKKSTTVILDVQSEVEPVFTANHGSGKYEDHVYTHKVNYQKDLYIYLSYEGLSTETVFVPASEMEASTIRKSVTFGTGLKTVVSISAEQITDISLATYETKNRVLDVSYSQKDKRQVSFTFEGREETIDITFKLEGYKDTNLHVEPYYLKGGLYTTNLRFLRLDEQAIVVKNTYCHVYDYTTDSLLTSLYSGNNQPSTYIIKTNRQYYVRYYDYDLQKDLFRRVDSSTGIEIIGREEGSVGPQPSYKGRFEITTVNDYNILNYDYHKVTLRKDNHTLINGGQLYGDLSNNGLLLQHYSSDKIYYIDDLSKCHTDVTMIDGEGGVTVVFVNNIESLPTINFSQKIFDYQDQESLISEFTSTLSGFQQCEYIIEDNTVKSSLLSFRNGIDLEFDIIDQNGELFYHYKEPYYGDIAISRTIDVNERSYNLNLNLIIDYLTYDKVNNVYRYKDISIDTSKTYVCVYDVAMVKNVASLASVYDKTSEKILPVINSIYFEGTIGHEYVIDTTYGTTINVVLRQLDIDSGFATYPVDCGYSLDCDDKYEIEIISKNTGVYFYTNERGILCVRGNTDMISFNYRLVSSDLVIDNLYFQGRNTYSGMRKVDLTPFYGKGIVPLDGKKQGDFFCYSYPIEGKQTQVACIYNNGTKSISNSLAIKYEDFEYDEELHAYAYTADRYIFFKLHDVTIKDLKFSTALHYGWDDYYVLDKKGSITFNDVKYDLASYENTYLSITNVDGNLVIVPEE